MAEPLSETALEMNDISMRFGDVWVLNDVDLKLPGYELRVLEALRDLELVPRTLVSGMFTSALDLIRSAEPALRLGWSVPRVRRDYTTDMLTAIPALAMLTGYRAMLPRRVRAALMQERFDAIMAHWRVVSRALVRVVALQALCRWGSTIAAILIVMLIEL